MPPRIQGAQPGNALGIPAGAHIRIFDAYIEAREAVQAAGGFQEAVDAGYFMEIEEAMSTSDFPTYMAYFIRQRFLDRFTEIQGSWSQYTREMSLEDFEEYTSFRWGRFPDIEEKALNGPYNELTIREFPAERVQLREWGNTFALTRQLIISDRLNEISKLPNLFAEALARTMSKVAAIDALQSNPTMYDGNALLSSAHNNLGAATALTANDPGAQLLQALELKLDTQTDDEGYKIRTPGAPYTLLIPVDYRWIANALVNNELLLNSGGTQLTPNLVRGRYNVIEERFFTDANNYYLLSDTSGPLAPIAALNLNGQTTPFLGLRDPGVRGVLGGDDPYSFEFDEVAYKLRHDFNFKPVEWRGIAGALP